MYLLVIISCCSVPQYHLAAHDCVFLHICVARVDALEFIVSVVSGAENSVNEPAEGGATALHYAVSGGHEECVRVLLQYGANINLFTTTEEVQVIVTRP